MKTNFTQQQKKTISNFITVNCRLIAFTVVFLFAATMSVKAQNTDLPNPDANIWSAPAGTLVIAMDNATQATPGYFNLKAYGLVVTLMNANKRVRWIISAGKTKGGTDISVTADRLYPTYLPGGLTNFKAGPFIIYPTDTAGVGAIINSFNAAQSASTRVNVYRTNAATTVDIRYDMIGRKPKAAVLDDGGNASIHTNYYQNAAVPVANYTVLGSATGLTSGCYTFASEPHNGQQGSFIDSIKSFVTLGGNFLAECHAITSYEDWATGHYQSTAGIDNTNNNIGSLVGYVNNDLSYSQFDGIYDPNVGGNTQTWSFSAGSTPQNNFFPIIQGNTAGTSSYYGATGAKMRNGTGGMVYFLGNHNLDGTAEERLNGQRMFLNAFLTPALTPACVGGGAVLAVKLNYFAAKKVNDKQALLSWSTATEINSKEFSVERSGDGVNFTEIAKVAAHGYSYTEQAYSAKDFAPLKGKNFYRLAEVELDGHITYSQVVVVNFDVNKTGMDIYPNPAYESVTISLSNLTNFKNNTVAVYDFAGKEVVKSQPITGSQVKLNVQSMQPGIYVARVTAADGTVTQGKIIITKN